MSTSVIVRPLDFPWRARFHTDSRWNDEMLARYQQAWFDYSWEQVLSDPFDTDMPLTLVEVFEKGKCLFSAPLYRNNIGEWSNFTINGGYQVPLGETRYLEWFSSDLPTLMEAFEKAALRGHIFDLAQLRSVHYGEGTLSRLTRRYTHLHPGAPLCMLAPMSTEDYIATTQKRKFRQAVRRAVRGFTGWTYCEGALTDPELVPLMREWFQHFDNQDGLENYFLGVLTQMAAFGDAKAFVIRDGAGELLGYDLLLEDDGWMSLLTPYHQVYRQRQVGYYAMLALMQAGWDGVFGKVPEGFSIGAQSYLGDYEGSEDRAQSYKVKWSTHNKPTWSVGLGMWENRDKAPQLHIGGMGHRALCLITALHRAGFKPKDPEVSTLEEYYEDERAIAPAGWDRPAFLEDAVRSALAGKDEERGSLPWRLWRLMDAAVGAAAVAATQV